MRGANPDSWTATTTNYHQNGCETYMRQERCEELRCETMVSSAPPSPTAPPLAPMASAASSADLDGLVATRTFTIFGNLRLLLASN
jgi:hypothetical protein